MASEADFYQFGGQRLYRLNLQIAQSKTDLQSGSYEPDCRPAALQCSNPRCSLDRIFLYMLNAPCQCIQHPLLIISQPAFGKGTYRLQESIRNRFFKFKIFCFSHYFLSPPCFMSVLRKSTAKFYVRFCGRFWLMGTNRHTIVHTGRKKSAHSEKGRSAQKAHSDKPEFNNEPLFSFSVAVHRRP